jgi:hypothetical protein
MSTVGPLGSGAKDPRVSIINAKKTSMAGPLAVLMEIRECPPSTLKMLMAAPQVSWGWGVLSPFK